MKIWQTRQEIQAGLPKNTGLGLTIGNFDGVHEGHQQLFKDFVLVCKNYSIESLVMTFDPHPKKIINPRDPLASRLFSIRDLEQKISDQGIDHLWVQKFNLAISKLTAKEFISKFLENLPIKFLLVGHDFRFGKKREGRIEDLLSWTEKQKIQLKVFSPFEVGEQRVSTSLIKETLMDGNLAKVEKLLGRKYYVEGEVVRGKQKGGGIGFPTANLELCIPIKNGVYLTKTFINEESFFSVTNVGFRPTVNSNLDPLNRNIETHILDKKINLYGKKIKVQFYKYIREEKKFSTLDELRIQIQEDVKYAKKEREA